MRTRFIYRRCSVRYVFHHTEYIIGPLANIVSASINSILLCISQLDKLLVDVNQLDEQNRADLRQRYKRSCIYLIMVSG